MSKRLLILLPALVAAGTTGHCQNEQIVAEGICDAMSANTKANFDAFCLPGPSTCHAALQAVQKKCSPRRGTDEYACLEQNETDQSLKMEGFVNLEANLTWAEDRLMFCDNCGSAIARSMASCGLLGLKQGANDFDISEIELGGAGQETKEKALRDNKLCNVALHDVSGGCVERDNQPFTRGNYKASAEALLLDEDGKSPPDFGVRTAEEMLTEMRNLRTNWKTLIAEAYEGDKTDLALSSSSSSGVKLCAPNPGTYANVEYADSMEARDKCQEEYEDRPSCGMANNHMSEGSRVAGDMSEDKPCQNTIPPTVVNVTTGVCNSTGTDFPYCCAEWSEKVADQVCSMKTNSKCSTSAAFQERCLPYKEQFSWRENICEPLEVCLDSSGEETCATCGTHKEDGPSCATYKQEEYEKVEVLTYQTCGGGASLLARDKFDGGKEFKTDDKCQASGGEKFPARGAALNSMLKFDERDETWFGKETTNRQNDWIEGTVPADWETKTLFTNTKDCKDTGAGKMKLGVRITDKVEEGGTPDVCKAEGSRILSQRQFFRAENHGNFEIPAEERETVIFEPNNYGSMTVEGNPFLNCLIIDPDNHPVKNKTLSIKDGNVYVVGGQNYGEGPLSITTVGQVVVADMRNSAVVKIENTDDAYLLGTTNLKDGKVEFEDVAGHVLECDNLGTINIQGVSKSDKKATIKDSRNKEGGTITANKVVLELENVTNAGMINAEDVTGLLEGATNEKSGVIKVNGGDYTFKGKGFTNKGTVEIGMKEDKRRRRLTQATTAKMEGGVNTGSIKIEGGTVDVTLDRNDGPITVAAGATGTIKLGDTSTVTSVTGPGATGVSVSAFKCTNNCQGSGGDKSGGTGGDSGDDSNSDPCFSRSTHACRALGVGSSPAVAWDDCYGANDDATVAGVRVPMTELIAGDAVLTTTRGAPSWTNVVVNQHRAAGTSSPMVHVEYESTRGTGSVKLTPDHVISLNGKFAPARDIVSGARLSDATVTHVTRTSDGIVNPITVCGTLLASGATGVPVLSSVYAEWIAAYMLAVTVYPLPVSLSSLLSVVFPSHVQAFYDTHLEAVNAGRGQIDAAMRAVPTAAMPVVAAAADIVLAAGLGVFALNSKLALAVGVAAAVWARNRRKV